MDSIVRRTFITALCVYAAGTGFALAAPEKQAISVQVYPGAMLNVPLYAALEQGIFKKHGLDVTLTAVPNGPLAQQALVTGDLDIAYGTSDPGMAAKSKGADTQIFLGLYNANIWALVTRNDVTVLDHAKSYPAVMKDLKKLRIGVTARGAASEFIVRSMFEDAGVNPDDASYVAVGGPATAYPAVIANQVDVVLAFEPLMTLMQTQNTGNILLDFRKGEGPAALQNMNGAFVTFNAARKFLSQNPNTVKAFQEAWREAVRWIQDSENRTSTKAIIKKYVAIGSVSNVDPVLNKLIDDNVKYFGWTVDPKAVAAYSDFLLKNKLIAKAVDPADYVAAVTPKP
jgi:NitT/TauT family transport system substrate-binding protein